MSNYSFYNECDGSIFESDNYWERDIMEYNEEQMESIVGDDNSNEINIDSENENDYQGEDNELEQGENEIINNELFIEENKTNEFKKTTSKEINEKINYSISNYSTREKSENINKFIERDKKVRFLLKKRGRKSKNNNPVNQTNTNDESKFRTDNKVRKIRIHLIKFAKNLLNNCLKKEFGINSKKIIKDIVEDLTSDITISFNLKFFDSPLEKIFSNPLNEKFKDKNHNIEVIKEIKKKIDEAPLTNELLGTKLIKVYEWFIEKDNYKSYYDKYGKDENTHNLNELLNELKEKEKYEYIISLRKTGMDLMESFNSDNARNVKKKRKIKFKGTNFEDYY